MFNYKSPFSTIQALLNPSRIHLGGQLQHNFQNLYLVLLAHPEIHVRSGCSAGATNWLHKLSCFNLRLQIYVLL